MSIIERERDKDLAFENLSGEELEFEIGSERMTAIGGEDIGGDIPSGVSLLKLNEPLIGCDAVARLGIVVKHMNSFSYLHCQFHFLIFFIYFKNK
jgi:hypothetical protein